MRLALMQPSADLATLVGGYCLCDDPGGVYDGETIRTAPQLGACLCIQLGGEVITDFRDRKPLMSYAGIQSRIRHYRPENRAKSLLIFLTPLGSIRFLPSSGRDVFDEGHDIGGLIGDAEVSRLHRAASAAPDDQAIARTVDTWLRRQFERRSGRVEFTRLAEAMRGIGASAMPVKAVAQRLDLSERQLERGFREHLGVSPKQYQQICRVTRSLQAVLTTEGDPLEGFADQAHQIRNWRSYLGFTPGHARRSGPSQLGRIFQRQAKGAREDRAHYL